MPRLCLCLVLFLSGAVLGQGASPEINEQYRNPDFGRWQRNFETEGREVYEKRLAIVETAAPRSGQTVADIGAGTGLFTRLFAARVGRPDRASLWTAGPERYVLRPVRRPRSRCGGRAEPAPLRARCGRPFPGSCASSFPGSCAA